MIKTLKTALKRLINETTDFFRDDKGNNSMTRLCTFMLCAGGIAFAFIHPEEEMGYIGMITLALGGKITQKKLSETPKDRILKS